MAFDFSGETLSPNLQHSAVMASRQHCAFVKHCCLPATMRARLSAYDTNLHPPGRGSSRTLEISALNRVGDPTLRWVVYQGAVLAGS